MRFDRDHVRVGKLLVTKAQQASTSPFVDGGSVQLTIGDTTGERTEHYGALVFSRQGSTHAVAVGWAGARVPWPGRYHPRRVFDRWRWKRNGAQSSDSFAARSGDKETT